MIGSGDDAEAEAFATIRARLHALAPPLIRDIPLHRLSQSAVERLLGAPPELTLNLRGIDWAIVGGESGPAARPIDSNWVTDIRDQCVKAGVAFFFKQWGGVQKKRAGRTLEGRTWDEMPRNLVRA